MAGINELVGQEGTLNISGGCLTPMSLKLTFRILEAAVRVEIDDKWSSPQQGRFEGFRSISFSRYVRLTEQLEGLLDSPPTPPTFATSELGVGVNLPAPKGIINGGACEMIEGPAPGPLISAIETFAEEIFERQRSHSRPESNRTQRRSIVLRLLPFALPFSIFGLVFWWHAQQNTAALGESCVTNGQCQSHLCNITDRGSFWIIGVEGHCTQHCGIGVSNDCPPSMRCAKSTLTTSRGTGIAHTFDSHLVAICTPN